MKAYPQKELLNNIRVLMDENYDGQPLAQLGDSEQLNLDQGLLASLIPSATAVLLASPSELLGDGIPINGELSWHSGVGVGSGSYSLPSDFLRLVAFKMSDWRFAVHETITDQNPLYAKQWSRFSGIRGCPQRPVVAIVSEGNRWILEFFSSSKGQDVYIAKATYIPQPTLHNGTLQLPPLLYQPFVHHVAATTLRRLGEEKRATALMATTRELLRLPENLHTKNSE